MELESEIREIIDPKKLVEATRTVTIEDWSSVLDGYVRNGVMEKLPDGRYLVLTATPPLQNPCKKGCDPDEPCKSSCRCECHVTTP